MHTRRTSNIIACCTAASPSPTLPRKWEREQMAPE
jgi:hypothetical protein